MVRSNAKLEMVVSTTITRVPRLYFLTWLSVRFRGQNTAITGKDDNMKIISSMRKHLHRGSPCVIITKDQSYAESIQNLGFTICDIINVPQRDFMLPRSKKKEKNFNSSSSTDTSRSSDCIVIFAVTLL